MWRVTVDKFETVRMSKAPRSAPKTLSSDGSNRDTGCHSRDRERQTQKITGASSFPPTWPTTKAACPRSRTSRVVQVHPTYPTIKGVASGATPLICISCTFPWYTFTASTVSFCLWLRWGESSWPCSTILIMTGWLQLKFREGDDLNQLTYHYYDQRVDPSSYYGNNFVTDGGIQARRLVSFHCTARPNVLSWRNRHEYLGPCPKVAGYRFTNGQAEICFWDDYLKTAWIGARTWDVELEFDPVVETWFVSDCWATSSHVLVSQYISRSAKESWFDYTDYKLK